MQSQPWSMFRKSRTILIIVIVFGSLYIGYRYYWRVMEYIHKTLFDHRNSQSKIDTVEGIERVLGSLKTASYEDLPSDYKASTWSDDPNYAPLLKGKQFYVIDRNDFFKKVVGDFRIVDFIAKDRYYRNAICNQRESYYWLMDKKLLLKLLDLQDVLELSGYNRNGFGITNGHRHPKYNSKIGGASKSCHIKGQALDIVVFDVNGNGRYEPKDKEIILKLLDQQIIKDKGGIGRYPGTRAVHFDVRGYKARWDSY